MIPGVTLRGDLSAPVSAEATTTVLGSRTGSLDGGSMN